MRRRTFLTVCTTASVGLAGCAALSGDTDDSVTSTSPPPDDTDTSSADETGTSTSSTRSASLVAEVDSLQPAVVTQATADSIGVQGGEESQYLYLDVTVESGEPPARDDLRVHFDGEQFEPGFRSRLWRGYQEQNGRYDVDSGEGWVLFELPETGDASDVALGRADGDDEWPIVSQPSVNFDGRLAAPSPPLSLDVSVPETVEPGTTPTLSFTVTNDGEHDGTFVGALNRSGPLVAMIPVTAISQVVPPGEATTFEVTDERSVDSPGDDELNDGEPDVNYDLHWTDGDRSYDVRVVDSSTES